MEGTRLIIFLLLIALLYILWRHQQSVSNNMSNKKKEIKKNERQKNNRPRVRSEQESILEDNISKISIPSEEEKKILNIKNKDNGYNLDSNFDDDTLDSFGSNLSFIEGTNDNNNDNNFFFQK